MLPVQKYPGSQFRSYRKMVIILLDYEMVPPVQVLIRNQAGVI